MIAQGTGAIAGTVTDPSGAAIPGATVSLQQGSAPNRTAATDSQGRFQLEGLAAGLYVVRVEAPGFQAVTREVRVQDDAAATTDIRLPLQAVIQKIQVIEEAREELHAVAGGTALVPFT
ncbi:MAG: carboxypeptidase-like regulatory domain-containing protein, partial [Candidatus Acidiferrales bacterium]